MNTPIQDYERWLNENGFQNNSIERYVFVAKSFIEWHNQLLNKSEYASSAVAARDLHAGKKYLINEATYQRGKQKPKKYSISLVNNSLKAIRTFFELSTEIHTGERGG